MSLVPSPKSCGPQYLSAALVPGVLGVKIVLYTIKAVKVHQARRNKEELELMESRLASRKAKPPEPRVDLSLHPPPRNSVGK